MMESRETSRVYSCCRVCSLQRLHPSAATQGYLQVVLDFTKELPEDAELDLGDIPGITPSE